MHHARVYMAARTLEIAGNSCHVLLDLVPSDFNLYGPFKKFSSSNKICKR